MTAAVSSLPSEAHEALDALGRFVLARERAVESLKRLGALDVPFDNSKRGFAPLEAALVHEASHIVDYLGDDEIPFTVVQDLHSNLERLIRLCEQEAGRDG